MCQSWYAVIGQTLDVIGFLIIAVEWYHQYRREHDRRMDLLQKAYERNSAEILGQPIPEQDEDKLMWREFQKLFMREWRWRRKVFFTGATLVILGFAFQVLGNWPHAIPSCGMTITGRRVSVEAHSTGGAVPTPTRLINTPR